MNKKREYYVKKFNKIVKTLEIIGICIFILGITISIIEYTLNYLNGKQEKTFLSNDDNTIKYYVDIKEDDIIYTDDLKVKIEIDDFDNKKSYKCVIKINDQNSLEEYFSEKDLNVNLKISDEGKQKINICISDDYNEAKNDINIYYIKPYQKQFAEKTSTKGVQVHYRKNGYENYEKSVNLLAKCGMQNVRSSIKWSEIENTKGERNFEYHDLWVNKLGENDIGIFSGINFMGNLIGSDYKINNKIELDKILDFMKEVFNRYPNIQFYEMFNEANYNSQITYNTDEDFKWYYEMVKGLKQISKENNKKIKIVSGAVACSRKDTNSKLSGRNFLNKLTEYGVYKYSEAYSYHPYDNANNKEQNVYFYELLNEYKENINGSGGFLGNYISEYGISNYKGNNVTETVQADKLVQQTVITDKYNVDLSMIYNFWDTGEDESNAGQMMGLIRHNYTPKPSYYAMKNYYQNTNGAEYIGSLNITNGLEAHTYDKDGHPLIIAWSNNTDNTYNFTLKKMTAKDIYGKEITPDSNGQIQITTSPVYLYNVPTNYFYQAISNTATTKYNEFTENYADQISKVQGLQQTINTLNQRMKDLSSTSNLDETTSINLMKQHFNLGNTLMQAYKSGTLQIEYVKLSSMLDALNDIGNSFEDLVTVSAKTRNANISETLDTINKADNLINDNDIEMIYPSKILQFSQDFYDKASYINGLEEENDIKTGLIVSKNLHSKLLSDWATQFANLYIDTYIKNNPVTIDYSETNPTNQNVTATLRTNAQITINNNSNSKAYTFTQNGTFTFDYTIKGQTFQQTATVNNIDKTAPTIEGVENDRLYLSEVTPKASDTNLKEVLLYKDNNQVQNYQQNTKITEDGHYKLVAKDSAGNQTSVEFDISRNPAIIDYSEVNLTNQDVVATVNSNFDVNVKNNSNQKAYTFKENGEFTFELNIKGAELQLTAKVDNIDKTPPTITDVEDKKQYMDKVTPKISDDNLNEVKLYFDSEEVQGYTPNSEITGEGFYKLVAKDLAGNETSVEFTIIENPDEKYQIKDGNILNIKNNTNQDIFRKKLKMSGEYSIYRNDTLISDNDKIATGDKLRKSTGEEYTLIVSGDINNDGDVNIKDIVMLRKYLLERNNLDENSLLAADCNLDGKDISIKDLIRMRLIALERDVN